MSHFTFFFESLHLKPKLLKSNVNKIRSSSRADLGPIGYCHLTFRLGSKIFTDKFMVLKNLILGLTGKPITTFAAIGNVNGYQYIT